MFIPVRKGNSMLVIFKMIYKMKLKICRIPNLHKILTEHQILNE